MKIKINFKGMVETFSALAVVISLVFVGLQMNENTRATRSAIAAETTATVSEWYNTMADNSDTSRLFRTFVAYPSTLNPDEQYRAIMKLHSFMVILQSTYYLEQEGTLDTNIRDSLSIVLGTVGTQPGMVMYWQSRRDIFTNENFIAFVDKVVKGEIAIGSGDIYTKTEID